MHRRAFRAARRRSRKEVSGSKTWIAGGEEAVAERGPAEAGADGGEGRVVVLYRPLVLPQHLAQCLVDACNQTKTKNGDHKRNLCFST